MGGPDKETCSMRYKSIIAPMLGGAAMILSTVVNAGLVNDVPSCYSALHLPFKSAEHQRLIYVLVDQTFKLDPQLQQSVIRNLNGMLGPGTKFVVAQFSAFSQGRYLKVLHTGIIEYPMTKEQAGNVPIHKLPKIKSCMRGQAKFSIKMADSSAQKAMKSATSSLHQSDILAALKTVSSAIRKDPAKQKVLFLVSDSLENSAVMSFYHHHVVARVDTKKAIAKAQAANMLGDFGGAKVFVLGGGSLPPAKHGSRAARDGYRDPVTLEHLKRFWTAYFKKSDANLVEFGEPALIDPVSY